MWKSGKLLGMMRCRHGLFLLSLSALLASAALTGCGVSSTPVEGGTMALHMAGTVMGGQQPVSGATVSLYIAGTGGNGTAVTNIMGTGTGSRLAYTTTNSSGQFSLAGDFACPAATSSYTPQAYLVATGGNPGLAGNVNNTSIAMVDALGPCGNLGSQTQITVNEVTTVAAAWALAGFATSPTSIAATATNTAGLANAFLNAQIIADPALGTAPSSTLPAGNTIETGKIYALADIVATCVNSDGVTPTSTSGLTPCQTLYKTSGQCSASCTSDTFSAALYIVKHPSQSVASLFGLIPTNQPYPTSLTAAPNEWTLSMSITSGGLNAPTTLALDTAGNVWVADYNGAVSAFSPQGTALSPTAGFGAGVLGGELYGIAVDGSNNVWVDIEEKPSSVSALNGISSGQTLGSVISINGSTYVSNSTYIYFPESLATTQNGNIIIGNYGDSTATVFNYTPANGFSYVLANAGTPYSQEPTDVSGDANGGIWLADNGGRTITHVDQNGYLISHPSCCLASNGVATDKFGNAWFANYYSNTVSEVASGCDTNASANAACHANPQNVVVFGADSTCNTSSATAASCGIAGGGIYSPSKVVIDGAQNVWVVNYHGGSFTEIAGNANALAAGTPISPNSTYDSYGNVVTQGGYGLDARLLDPFGLAVDASGNMWVTSKDTSTLVAFFGLAAPTATPKVPIPVTP